MRWCALLHARKLRRERDGIRWEYEKSVLITIGNITKSWAGVERIFDEFIAWYQHHCINFPSKHPRDFKGKLAYIERVERDERLTEQARNFFRDVRESAQRLAHDRNTIIHGLLTHKGGFSLEWSSQKVLYNGQNAILEHRTFHYDDLQNLSLEISTLLAKLAPAIWILIGNNPDKYSAQDVERALSNLGAL